MKKGVWGWLYPLKDEFTFLELKKDEYTVGKDPNCSYVVTETQLDRYDYSALSKKQFKITKKKDGVYLEDIAGTYINNKKVGPGEKTILKHNDSIAIARISTKVFVYMERSAIELSAPTLPTVINENYYMSYKLGQGGFGEVTLVFEKMTGKRFAMKTVKINPNILKYARTEAEILRTIQHPCIIMTKQVVDTLSSLFIVMEMMDGGDLSRRVISKTLTEAHNKLIFFQLVQAIQYLHKHNVVHRDIKPENVLLASKNNETLIKVTDFGVSKMLKPGTVMDTHVGTPLYIAPEIKKSWGSPIYTNMVDVWSLGVLLYVCLSGSKPFNENAVLESNVVTFPSYKWSSISSSAVKLIKSMLQVNPTNRIGIEEILAHNWLKDETMRRKAHELMWPGKRYMPAASPAPVASQAPAPPPHTKNSLPEKSNRFLPRGVHQYMSQRAKPGIPLLAPQPRLVHANLNYQPERQNVVHPPRQVLANSPLEKKPYMYPSSPRNEAGALYQPQKVEVKPYLSPIDKPQNNLSLQQKYEANVVAKPYVSPFERKPLLSSQQKLEAKHNIKPASPVNKKPMQLPPLGKYEVKPHVKPYASPVEKRPFALQKDDAKNSIVHGTTNGISLLMNLINVRINGQEEQCIGVTSPTRPQPILHDIG